MRKSNPLITAMALVTVGFLYLPLVAVAVFSVNATRYGLVWRGFTLDWYIKLFHNEFILEAAWNTLVLALVPQVFAALESSAIRAVAAVLVVIFAFFFVTVSSRIVGLVGVTSNPTSGMTIATLLGTSLIFAALVGNTLIAVTKLGAAAVTGSDSVAQLSRKHAARRPRPPLPRPGSTSSARMSSRSSPSSFMALRVSS
mgnify:CR=1 FL=1